MIKIINCITFDNDILTKDKLCELIDSTKFQIGAFNKSECVRMGFTKIKSPLENLFLESAGGEHILCKFLIGEKKVKASTVKLMAEERLSVLTEKGIDSTLKQCKEEVKNELLNTATPDYTEFWALFDFNNKLVFTDKSGSNSDSFLAHIKNNIDTNPFGSLIKPSLVTDTQKLNTWLTDPSTLPDGYELGHSVTLNNIDGSKGSFVDVEIETSEAVSNFVSEGGVAKKIQLHMGEKASFEVNDKGLIKGIKPLGYTQERIDDYLGEGSSEDELAELQIRTQIIAMDLVELTKTFYNIDD